MSESIYKQTVEKWGRISQAFMVNEECAELITALSQHFRGRIGEYQVAEEVADVQIMLEQIPFIVTGDDKGAQDFSELVARIKKTKTARLAALLAMPEAER